MHRNVNVDNLAHNLRPMTGTFAQATSTSTAATLASLYATAASATGFPADMKYLEIESEGAVRWRSDGTDPTTSVGFRMADTVRFMVSRTEALKMKVISATDIKINLQPHT